MAEYQNNSIINEIESIIRDNRIFQYTAELSNTNDPQKKDKLIKIIQELKVTTEQENNDTTRKKKEQLIENIENHIYKQPWNKLKDFQRELKLMEFIEEKYNNHKNKNNLIILLKKEINNLKTNKSVKYNSEQMKIDSIPNLQEINEDFKMDYSNDNVKNNKSKKISKKV